MIPILNVVCFYWQGKATSGWANLSLGKDYVNRLFHSVFRNLTIPRQFICFLQSGISTEGLDPGIKVHFFDVPIWEGCLPKLYVFSNEAGLFGRVVMMDLDLIVTGSLDEMFSYSGPFMTRGEPRAQNVAGGDIVFFEAGTYSRFWDMLVKNPKKLVEMTHGGRERYFYRMQFKGNQDFVQALFPGQIVSYKVDMRRQNKTNEVLTNCRLISCHGHPKPHELLMLDWIKEYWK